METWRKFLIGYNARGYESDIVVYMYIITHPNCTTAQIRKELGGLCDIDDTISHYKDLGLIKAENGYYC